MTSKHVLKISSICDFFENDNNIIKRGENALESGHVLKMQFDADIMSVRGEVQASMKDKTYKVEIVLKKEGQIMSAKCSCPRGIICHHIAALCLFGHYNISVTDQECMWKAPKIKYTAIKTAEELYPSNKYCAINRNMTEEEIESLRCKLNELGNTVGFTWLLQKEVEPSEIISLLAIDNIIQSQEFIESMNKSEILKTKCQLDDAAIELIAEITEGQGQNENWHIIRKFRITSSNFGLVLGACRRNRFPDSFYKTLSGAYNLDGVKAIQWGRTHEKNGLEYLKSNFNLDVYPTGIWLTNSGVLGASADGFVGTDAIVEIKCPFAYRTGSLRDHLKKQKNYIVHFDDNDQLCINADHNYYHQVQGTLHITKRKKCHLCIWTPEDVLVVMINYDELWSQNLDILQNFYFQHYLPLFTS